jgi:hypothetical protein
VSLAIMDESSIRMRSNMEKVLRAMDVIPSFRDDGTEDSGRAGTPRQASSWPQMIEPHHLSASQTPVGAAADGKDRAKNGPVIPEFDLGERILAEQRRMTARKRKAPGASDIEPGGRTQDKPVAPRPSLAAPSAEELLQLQQIVADIVARDIERLCAGPGTTQC